MAEKRKKEDKKEEEKQWADLMMALVQNWHCQVILSGTWMCQVSSPQRRMEDSNADTEAAGTVEWLLMESVGWQAYIK